MTETLATRFQQSRGRPIEVGGKTVHSILRLQQGVGTKVYDLRRLQAKAAPVSGLRIKVENGRLGIEGQEHDEIVLWSDTAPEQVRLSVSARADCVIKFWNVWKVGDLVQAWVGNAGMCIEEDAGGFTLNCSDGVGAVDFSEFVVEVRVQE